MIDFSQARINMIDGQIKPAGVVDMRVLESFTDIPRELFVPEKLKNIAYTDESLDIGQGRFLLSPIIYAKMVQAAHIRESDVVLDIGSAFGYSSAILSPLVTTVIALEHNKRQMDKATRLWTQLSVCNIALIEGKLPNGVPDQAPYSLIIINGSVSEVPQEIFDQMDNEGRLITIIKETHSSVGRATLFVKNSNGYVSSKKLFDANAPFLKGFDPKTNFVF